MKKFKTLASVVLVMMMILSMMVPVMAGTITVPGDKDDDGNDDLEAYTAYKIFDVTKLMNADGKTVDGYAYSIKATDPWVTVLQDEDQTWVTLTLSADGSEYVVSATTSFTDEAATKAFAAYLNGNIPATARVTELAEGSNTVADGYYLIVSSLGSALALTTTDIPVTITEKNSYPTLTKAVDDEDAQIGDTVTFTLTVTVPATVDKNMVIIDTYDNTFEVDYDSFVVKAGSTPLTENTDYTIGAYYLDDDTDGFQLTLKPTANVIGKTVTIKYEAELEKTASIGDANTNKAHLCYSNYKTPEVTAKVYTMQYELTKVTKVNGADVQISGAEFKLYTTAAGGDAIKFVYSKDSNGNEYYRVADSTETTGTTDTIKVGKATIQGLDAKVTYYLEETKAPAGYNMLTERHSFILSDEDSERFNTSEKIENQTGTELPSTGGIGTTIFYCVGGIMAVGAFVLLITKKRMNRGM